MSGNLLTPVWADSSWRPNYSVREWEALLGQARQSRLLARLACHLLDSERLSQVPPGPRPHLESALRLADRQQHEIRWEVDQICKAL